MEQSRANNESHFSGGIRDGFYSVSNSNPRVNIIQKVIIDWTDAFSHYGNICSRKVFMEPVQSMIYLEYNLFNS